MSTSNPDFNTRSKFTKGEKCIFVHLIFTFVALILIVLIYCAHLLAVRHFGRDAYRLSRRSFAGTDRNTTDSIDEEPKAYRCVGAVYVGGVPACAAALVAARWSLAPARCVSARARPPLAHLLPFWTIRYHHGASAVRRGAVHPSYNDDELAANVGLLQHELALHAPACAVLSLKMQDDLLMDNIKDAAIVGWQTEGGTKARGVRVAAREDCARRAAAAGVVVRALRHELCVAYAAHAVRVAHADDPHPMLGSVLFVEERMVGIASWGDRSCEGFPIIVLQVARFQHWLDTTMSLWDTPNQ